MNAIISFSFIFILALGAGLAYDLQQVGLALALGFMTAMMVLACMLSYLGGNLK